MTAYVCREHPTQPISPRGAGCQACARSRVAASQHETGVHSGRRSWEARCACGWHYNHRRREYADTAAREHVAALSLSIRRTNPRRSTP